MSEIYGISLVVQGREAVAKPDSQDVYKDDVVVFYTLTPNTYFQVEINNVNHFFNDERPGILEIVSTSQPLALVVNLPEELQNGPVIKVYYISIVKQKFLSATKVAPRIVLKPFQQRKKHSIKAR